MNYRSILSSGSYYLEDFDYQSILVDSGIIVQWCAGFGGGCEIHNVNPAAGQLGKIQTETKMECGLKTQWAVNYFYSSFSP